MITAIRRIQFCAGHRVHKHESKCANMHGHNYVAHIEVEMDPNSEVGIKHRDTRLDDIGRVIDFSVIKERIGTWIETFWDHGFIFYEKDEELRLMFQAGGVLDKQKSYALQLNPTAENMAIYLLRTVCPMLLGDIGVLAVSVELEETENCRVRVSI